MHNANENAAAEAVRAQLRHLLDGMIELERVLPPVTHLPSEHTWAMAACRNRGRREP
jgi:hypothetical protein